MLVVLTLCFAAKGKAQLYDSLAKGLPEVPHMAYYDSTFNKLYTSGWFYQTNDGITINGIGSWNGAEWGALGLGFIYAPSCCTGNGYALSAIRYDSFIYFVGPMNYADTLQVGYIARWDGTSWDTVPNSVGAGGYKAVTHDSSLYVCGGINGINGDNSIKMVARWNGTNWSALGDPLTIIKTGYIATCMAFMNGDLYVGGSFEKLTGEPIHLIKWDGVSWSVPGNGMLEGGISNIWDMAVYKNELYITGLFSKYATGGSGTSQHLTKWDGTQFKSIGGDGPDVWCKALCVHNNKLYLGGGFSYINGMPARAFASFDGTDWCGYNTTSLVDISEISAYRGDTLALCGAWFVEGGDTLSNIALWTGESYVDTCRALTAGVQDNATDETLIKLYPNPNTGRFMLELPETIRQGTLLIANSLGQPVFQKALNNENFVQVDISTHTKGVYYVLISTPDTTYRKKVMLE